MAFRDDSDALRNRVDALEDELAQARDDAERLRAERDQALLQHDAPSDPNLHAGTKLWVEWRKTWWPATVLRPIGHGRYRIHYDGWSALYDEDVDATRMAPRDRPPPGRRAQTATVLFVVVAVLVAIIAAVGFLASTQEASEVYQDGRGGAPVNAAVLTSLTDVHVGDAVWIEWSGSWYAGSIVSVDVTNGHARVHFDGYSDSSDEDATLDRLRGR